MLVTAASGHRVPRAEKPRTYIECAPDEPVDVPDTSYYRRRVEAGELVQVRRVEAGEPVQVKKRGAKAAAKGASE
jgi:hypothetical protein